MTAIPEAITAFQAEFAGTDVARRFTDDELELIYSLAYNLYTQGKYEEAVRYFSFLTVYRPTSTRFLKGLGAAQFMGKRYVEATATYSFVILLDPADAEALCLNGQALLMSGELEDARACLEFATQVPGGKPEFAAKAKALLELISA
ncbi:tetratricopeptide repeat protein [Pseudothauera rhizosphaerae]|uniref:Tetratricopeptide repeat protein n=1 Tax=Pseudothauera rhizosphaerae TaxID=2565932 RepID=A0A4S4AER3_9RHOO|nr:tetratricopeptide repeat protein [Pseudothauera rhizosphaerae]THF57276.1 tetratricopeptide repeat protein [Pseudothauera rhizosphaerae]